MISGGHIVYLRPVYHHLSPNPSECAIDATRAIMYKASLLNSYFESMVTRESPLNPKQHYCLNSMQEKSYHYSTITSERIIKLPKNLKTNMAAGPDDLAPTVLKELSIENTSILQKIFAKPLNSHIVYLLIGRKPILIPF